MDTPFLSIIYYFMILQVNFISSTAKYIADDIAATQIITKSNTI